MIERSEHDLDYKTLLQEKIQGLHRKPPSYFVVAESGPGSRSHVRGGGAAGRAGARDRGMGKSKKQAEQAAAREAFNSLE